MARKRPGGNEIGTRVRNARARLGWSRETLAHEAGLSWSAVTQVESGRRTNLRPDTLSALAAALGLTIDYLVTGSATSTRIFRHRVLFFATDEAFVAEAGAFVAEGAEREEPTLVVARPDHVRRLRKGLGKQAKAVDFGDATKWYTKPEATLGRFRAYATDRVEDGAAWVRIVGQPVFVGRTAAERRRWQRQESLINLAWAHLPLTLICAYDERAAPPASVREACATHPETIRDGEAKASADYVDPEAYALEAAP